MTCEKWKSFCLIIERGKLISCLSVKKLRIVKIVDFFPPFFFSFVEMMMMYDTRK